MFQGSFKSVLRRFQGKFKGLINVKRVSKVGKFVLSSFKGGSRIFERSLKSVSGKFKCCFKDFFKKFQLKSVSKSFKGISQKFQGYFKED